MANISYVNGLYCNIQEAKIDINDNWVKEHQSYFDVGVALHSLHFGDTKTVSKNNKISSLISSGNSFLDKHSSSY